MFDMKSWTNEFLEKAKNPMSQDLHQIFMQLVMDEDDTNFSLEGINTQFLYQLIEKRAQHIGLQMSEALKVFLMFLSQTPGNAVMYLYVIRMKAKEANMQDFADTFPHGVLSQEDLKTMWNKQKGYKVGVKVDNCLDSYQFA